MIEIKELSREERRKLTADSRELALRIIEELPTDKKEVLRRAVDRNGMLTSSYNLEHGTLEVYKQGWYLKLEGTRVNFNVWVTDNDGEFVYERKPRVLDFLYDVNLRFSESDFDGV